MRRCGDRMVVDGAVAQSRDAGSVPEFISQRELRNDNAEIMRRVEAGETFVVTRNGKPVADLVRRPRRPRACPC